MCIHTCVCISVCIQTPTSIFICTCIRMLIHAVVVLLCCCGPTLQLICSAGYLLPVPGAVAGLAAGNWIHISATALQRESVPGVFLDSCPSSPSPGPGPGPFPLDSLDFEFF